MTTHAPALPLVQTVYKDTRILIFSFLTCIALGLISGLLGSGWVSIRADFAQPVEAMGMVLFASVSAYFLSSTFSGTVVNRFGVGRSFLLGAVLVTVGMTSYTFAPFWVLFILAAVFQGLGSGLIDATLNTYFAAHYSLRAMNFLHAMFGIGVTISPILVTNPNFTWRMGYGIVTFTMVLVLIGAFLSLPSWREFHKLSTGQPYTPIRLKDTLRHPIIWLGIITFLLYAGLEMIAGKWGTTLFVEGRGIPENIAGEMVARYWASFTIGRLLFSVLAGKIKDQMLIRCAILIAMVGATLIALNRGSQLDELGLLILGISLAPIFPVLVAMTPRYVGLQHAPNAIGIQMAGSAIGVWLLPTLVGVIASATTFEIAMPIVIFSCVIFFMCAEFLMQYIRRRAETLSSHDQS